jgi:hypothetical protein
MSDDKVPEVKCFTCKGEGLIEERKCGYCKGTGILKLKFAEDEGLGYLSTYTDRILEALKEVTGIEPMFISDETSIDHFPLEEGDLKKMSEILGVEVKENDLFPDIAKRMKNA